MGKYQGGRRYKSYWRSARDFANAARNWSPYVLPGLSSIRVRRPPRRGRKVPTKTSTRLKRPYRGFTTLTQSQRKRKYGLYRNKPGCSTPMEICKIYPQKVYTEGFPNLNKKTKKDVEIWNTRTTLTALQKTSSVNEVAYWDEVIGNKTDLELIEGLSKNKDPTTGVNNFINMAAIGATGTKIAVKGSLNIRAKNNTGTDCHIMVYYGIMKVSTDSPIITLNRDGLQDHVAENSGAIANPEKSFCFYPEHSDIFSRYCKILKKERACIEPGKEVQFEINMKSIVLDPEMLDNINLNHIADCTGFVLVRQHGQVGHDQTATAQVGFLTSALDIIATRRYSFGFASGLKIPVRECAETYGTITTGVAANMEGFEVEDNPV